MRGDVGRYAPAYSSPWPPAECRRCVEHLHGRDDAPRRISAHESRQIPAPLGPLGESRRISAHLVDSRARGRARRRPLRRGPSPTGQAARATRCLVEATLEEARGLKTGGSRSSAARCRRGRGGWSARRAAAGRASAPRRAPAWLVPQPQGGDTVSCSVLRAPREYTGDECSEYGRLRPNAAECVPSRALVGIQESVFRF